MRIREEFLPVLILLMGWAQQPNQGSAANNRGLFQKAAAELPAAITEAKKDGLPLHMSDLVRSVPANQNAAPLYLKAFADMKNLPIEVFTAAHAPAQDFKPSKAALTLRGCATVLTELRRAAQLPHYYFTPPKSPYVIDFPNLATFKQAAFLLCFDALCQASRRNFDSASKNIDCVFRMVDQLQEQPTLIGELVIIPMAQKAYLALDNIMDANHADPAVARVLWRVASSSRPSLPAGRAFADETVGGYESLKEIRGMADKEREKLEKDEDFKPIIDATVGIPSQVVADAFRARLLQFRLALCKTAGAQGKTGNEKVADFKRLGEAEDNGDVTHLYMKFTGTQFGQALTAMYRYSEMRDLTLIGLQIMKDHKPGTTWPKNLPSGEPLDEMTGKPFGYKSSAQGFTV